MTPAIVQYLLIALQTLPSVIAAGGQLAAETAALRAQLQAFVAENRDPTPAEWQAQSQKLSDSLAALLAAKPATA